MFIGPGVLACATCGVPLPSSNYEYKIDMWDLALNVPRNAENVKMFSQPAARTASFSQLCHCGSLIY